MRNDQAMWENALRAELKDLLTRYDATLLVQDGKMAIDVEERDDNSFASHPGFEVNLGTMVCPARLDGSDK